MSYEIVVFDADQEGPQDISPRNTRPCSSVADAEAYLERKWGCAERSGSAAKAWLFTSGTYEIVQKWECGEGEADWVRC